MFQSYRRRAATFFAFVLLAALAVPATAGATGGGGAGERTYLVTIENLTDGQPFTPPVLATHHRRTSVFDVGTTASAGVQGLAENGDVPGLVAELQADGRVDGITVADAAGPILPGGEITVEITSSRRHRRISIASMLICTNDGFAGIDSLRLPTAAADPTVVYLNAYDAGTEMNTELFGDLVPPCGPLTGVDSGGQGTGMSNLALAEGGAIAAHQGIAGGADLDPAIHDWAAPVAKVTIMRIDNAAQYEVTVSNSTSGQPFTPPVLATHKRGEEIFEVGDEASHAIQQLAENGDVPGLVAELNSDGDFGAVVVGDGPVVPGAEATYTFWAPRNKRRISFASMLICSNDGFAGLDGARLPRWAGETSSFALEAYDAGSELNTEAFADLVPPCGPLTGVDSGGQGTGMSNLALAENGEITHHAGIAGSGDLDATLHGWTGSVGALTITRLN